MNPDDPHPFSPPSGSPPPINPWRTPSFSASLGYAWQGLKEGLRCERNLRIDAAAAVLVTALSWALKVPARDFLWIGLAITLVVVAELFNTATEAVVNLVTEAYHPQAKLAKDVAAGACLVAAGFAVWVGIVILGPPLLGSWHA